GSKPFRSLTGVEYGAGLSGICGTVMRRLGLVPPLASYCTICCHTPTFHPVALVPTAGEIVVFEVVVKTSAGDGTICADMPAGEIWVTFSRPRICDLLLLGVSVPLTALTSKKVLR